MLTLAALISVSSSLGYLLPAVIGLESMGIPSPGETALVLAAVLASQGKLQIELVLAIGIASAIIGDNIGYLLGRHFGREVLVAPGPLHHRRVKLIARGDRFFDRHGNKAVFIGRWIALIRVAAAWLAGINHMPFREFFFWNALGGITWGVTFGLAGYFGGEAAAKVIARFGIVAAIVIALVLAPVLIFRRLRERKMRAGADADAGGPLRADVAAPERPAADEHHPARAGQGAGSDPARPTADP
ncbi:MAG: DedA family protein [Solirubrobacterales bacterium]|nr:DedA family protein [Solirubrobacterales bacterium]